MRRGAYDVHFEEVERVLEALVADTNRGANLGIRVDDGTGLLTVWCVEDVGCLAELERSVG